MERTGNLASRLEIGGDAHEQILTGNFNGADEPIDVLSSLVEMQRIEWDLLIARRNLIEYRNGLGRAPAGGFEVAQD